MIRLVATDLDGTVVRRDGSMSERTARALQAVEDAGLRLVLVTGRPPRWMASVVEATGHRGLAICANGAYVYDLHRERIVERFLMQPVDAREAVRLVRERLPRAGFAVEREGGFSHDPQYHPRWDVEPRHVAAVEELIGEPLGKLLVRDETSTGDAMLHAVRGPLAGIVDVTHSNVNDCLLELSARGVSKATTLAHLARKWGIERQEVMAFGDMPNDVAMLQWAGVGYAVADAHPEVLAAVDRVTRSVEHDGVATVLEALLSGS